MSKSRISSKIRSRPGTRDKPGPRSEPGMRPTPVPLRDEHITLVQAVKIAGLVGSGGQAKRFVREGSITVNGVPEARPGRKLMAGDQFAVGDQVWVIER
jgi:ribosome-associated protein